MCARGQDPFDFGSIWGAWCGPGFVGFGKRAGRGGRGRKRRFFDRGDLKYIVLRLLKRKPMHGYEVMQALEEESGGWYSASAGSVYPVLQMLQDQGYVDSAEEDGKRVYRITEAGLAFLDRNSDRVDDVFDRVSDFAERFTGGDMGDVTRSFMRLAQAAFDEATRHSGDSAAMARLKEILERAARDIRTAGTRPDTQEA
jgi:DNA-binding PadR family transcriptional regulator